jgi:L,D-transpeptidase-like protein
MITSTSKMLDPSSMVNVKHRISVAVIVVLCLLALACRTKTDRNKHESSEVSKPTGKAVNMSTPTQNKPETETTTNSTQMDLRMSVNLPAFQLVLWKAGSAAAFYSIGVGRRQFRTIVGSRKAQGIVWNPDWVPPDSPWVGEMPGIEPGQRIRAGDPRNPLGKVKIPFGGPYLIHEAAKSSDIGHLVSHGCIRMRRVDIYNLVEEIMAARGWPISKDRVEKAKRSRQRLVLRLAPPIPIEINYETIVVEGSTLHVYRDIYGKHQNTVADLRSRLGAGGIDTSRITDKTLLALIKQSTRRGFAVAQIADLQ